MSTIGICEGDRHTYRHDLESLFYTMLWVAVCYTGPTTESKLSENSRLKDWMGMDFAAIAEAKRLSVQGIEDVVAEFSESFVKYKGLARRLREVLFGEDEDICTGTEES